MLIKPCHIGPSTPALLGRRRSFGGDTHGVKTCGLTRQHGFEADVTLPMGAIIIDIPEALTATETQRAQSDGSSISTIAAIVLAMDVKRVQMFIAPVESDLQHRVEVGQGRVTTHEQTAPDQRTDLSQDDTQLIDSRRFCWLAHRMSVAQCVGSLKVSPCGI